MVTRPIHKMFYQAPQKGPGRFKSSYKSKDNMAILKRATKCASLVASS